MPPSTQDILERQLLQLRRRWKWVVCLRGLARTAAVTLLAIMVACLIDYFIELPMAARYALTGILGVIAVTSAAWLWLRPLVQRVSRKRLAWLIEQGCPQLNEILISSIELENGSDKGISPELIARIIDEAQIEIDTIKAPDAFPLTWRQLRRPLTILLVFLGALLLPPLQFPQLVNRVTWPSPRDAGIGSFTLDLLSPRRQRFIEGQSALFTVKPSDPEIKQVSLYVRDESWREQRFDMTRDPITGRFTYRLKNLYRPLQYWAKSGKVSTEVRDLDVYKRPKVKLFSFRVIPPRHTGLPAYSRESTTGDAKIAQGSTVLLTVRATKELTAAEFILGDTRILGTVDESRRTASCRFDLANTTNYRLVLRDKRGLSSPGHLEYTLHALSDEPPHVQLRYPAHDLFLSPDEDLRLQWRVKDDYGIAEQEIVFVVNHGTEQVQPLSSVTMTEVRVNLSELSLQPADEMIIWIRAFDSAGQRQESAPRRVTLVANRKFHSAGEFFALNKRMLQQLQQARGTLAQISRTLDEVQLSEAAESREGEDLSHNLNMLTHQTDRFNRQLLQLEQDAVRLRQNGFFPFSGYVTQEIYRRLRHHRVFALHRLLDPSGGSTALLEFRELLANTERTLKHLSRHGRVTVAKTISANLLLTLDRAFAQSDDEVALIAAATRIQEQLVQLQLMLNETNHEETAQRNPEAAKDRKALHQELQGFCKQIQEEAQDTQAFKKVVDSFGPSQPTFETSLQRTGRNISLYNSPTDWAIVRRAGEEFSAGNSRLPHRIADDQLLAGVFEQTLENQSQSHLQALVAAMRPIRRHDELHLLQLQLLSLEQSLDRQQPLVIELLELPSRRAADQITRQILEELHGQAIALKSFPLEGRTLETTAYLRPVSKHCKKIVPPLEQFLAALRSNQAAQAQTLFDRALQAVRAAHKQSEQFLKTLRNRRNLARKSLRKLSPSPSNRLQQALAASVQTAANEAAPQRLVMDSFREAVRTTADNLKRQALAELQQTNEPLPNAKTNLLLAADLHDIYQSRLRPIMRLLGQLESGNTGPMQAESTDASPGLPQQQTLQAAARQHLILANRRAGEVLLVLQQLEAADQGELSFAQVLDAKEKAYKRGREHLPEALLRQLDLLAAVRRQRRQLDDVVEQIQQNRSRQQDRRDSALEISLRTIRRKLMEALAGKQSILVSHLARQQLDLSLAAVNELLHELRNNSPGKPGRSAQTRKQQDQRRSDKFDALLRELLYLEGFRGLLGHLDQPAADLLNRELKPQFDLLMAKSKTGQAAGPERRQATQTLRKLRLILTDYIPDFNVRIRRTPKLAEPYTDMPFWQINTKLDQLKHILTAAEVDASQATQLETQIAAERIQAVKLLDALPMNRLTKKEQSAVTNRRQGWDRQKLSEQAETLVQIADKFQTATPETVALREQAAAMKSEIETEKQAADLRQASRHSAATGANLARQIARLAEQQTNSLLSADLARIARHLEDNLALSDFTAARRNLQAMRQNLDMLQKPEPVQPPEGKWRSLLREPDKTELMDWHALHGLYRESALNGDSDETAAAAIHDLNFARAAEMARDQVAAADLQTAAARQGIFPADAADGSTPFASVSDWTLQRFFAAKDPEGTLQRLRDQLDDMQKRVDEVRDAQGTGGLTEKWWNQFATQAKQVEHQRSILGFTAFPLIQAIRTTMTKPSPDQLEVIRRILTSYRQERNGRQQEWERQQQRLRSAQFLLLQTRDFQSLRRELQQHDRQLALSVKLAAGAALDDEELTRRIQLASTVTDKAAVLRQIADKLRAEQPEVATKLEARAAALTRNATRRNLEQHVRQLQQAVAANAAELAKTLQTDCRPGAHQARKDALALSATMKDDPNPADPFTKTEGIVASLSVTSPVAPAPLVDPFVFEAAAIAAALRDQSAILKAWAGDFDGAATSFRETKPVNAAHAELLRTAASVFAAARRTSEMNVSPELQAILVAADQLLPELPESQRERLAQAVHATRLQRYEWAGSELNQLLRPMPEDLAALVDSFAVALASAARARPTRATTRNAAMEGIRQQIHILRHDSPPVVQAELQAAETALSEQRRDDAVTHLQIAAVGSPRSRLETYHVLINRLNQEPIDSPKLPAALSWFAQRGILQQSARGETPQNFTLTDQNELENAAQTSWGYARHDFAQAAQNHLSRNSKPQERPPVRFSLPLPRLSSEQQDRFRRHLQYRRLTFLLTTANAIDETRSVLNKLHQAAKTSQGLDETTVLDIEARLTRIEHRRRLLGSADHQATAVLLPRLRKITDAEEHDPTALQELVRRLNKLLLRYKQGLTPELDSAGEEHKRSRLRLRISIALRQDRRQEFSREQTGALAAKLRETLSSAGNPALRIPHRTCTQLLRSIQAGRLDRAQTQVRLLAKQLSACHTRRPVSVPLNEEAFTAGDRAAQLNNQDALAQADIGDYQAAAASLRAMAEAADGEHRDYIVRTADLYQAAAAAQLEQLPPALATAVLAAEAARRHLPPAAQSALDFTCRAIRTGHLLRAGGHLEQLEIHRRGKQTPVVKTLAIELQKSLNTQTDHVWAGNMSEFDGPIEELREAARQSPPVHRRILQMELHQAETALNQRDYDRAEQHLRLVGAGLPTIIGNRARNLAARCEVQARLYYKDLSQPARKALQVMPKLEPELLARLHRKNYLFAAEEAEKRNNGSAAHGFRRARELQQKEGPPALDRLLQNRDLRNRLQRLDPFILQALTQGRLFAACVLLQRRLQSFHPERIRLLRTLQTADRQLTNLQAPLSKAKEALAEYRFGDAAERLAAIPQTTELAAVFQAAEDELDQIILTILEEASQDPSPEKQLIMQNCADQLMQDRLPAALDNRMLEGSLRKRTQKLKQLSESGIVRLESLHLEAKNQLPELRTARQLAQEREAVIAAETDMHKDSPETQMLTKLEQSLAEGNVTAALTAAQNHYWKPATLLLIKDELATAAAQLPTYEKMQQSQAPLNPPPAEGTRLTGRALASLQSGLQQLGETGSPTLSLPPLVQSTAELTQVSSYLSREVRRQAVRAFNSDNDGEGRSAANLAEVLKDGSGPFERVTRSLFRKRPEHFFGGQRGIKRTYDQYYQEANQKYLEWLARESRKWQKKDNN